MTVQNSHRETLSKPAPIPPSTRKSGSSGGGRCPPSKTKQIKHSRYITKNCATIWFSSLGSGYYFTDKMGLELSYDFAQSASIFYDDPKELTISYFQEINKNLSIEVYRLVGFSNNSPDQGIGLELTILTLCKCLAIDK